MKKKEKIFLKVLLRYLPKTLSNFTGAFKYEVKYTSEYLKVRHTESVVGEARYSQICLFEPYNLVLHQRNFDQRFFLPFY